MVYIPDNSHINQNKEYGEIVNFHAKRGEINTESVSHEGIVRASEVAHGLFDVSGYENQGKTFAQEIENVKYNDVTLMQNYMTVMSATMTAEDYGQLTQDGINPLESDVEVTVTMLDKIKARLAESGVIIEGYNDDLTREQLVEITGSAQMAADIEKTFRENDIPMSEERVKECVAALNMALDIDAVTDGMCDYILRNGVDPTIENLYRVRHSSCETAGNCGGFYSQDVPGYMARQGESFDKSKNIERIRETIVEAGLEVNEFTENESRWIIENGILYNKTNVKTLHELWELNAPFESDEVLESIAFAAQKGESLPGSHLGRNVNIAAKARDNLIEFNKRISEDSPESVKARMSLETARVSMTYESSYRLVKRGMTVDKTALDEMVNALKALEDETNRVLFGNSDESDEVTAAKGALYHKTREAITELPFMPASVIAQKLNGTGDITIGFTIKAGLALKAEYDKAGEAYETLGTQVRSDLGDNIKKAFANADELLRELGLDVTERNLRGVRILGYNRMAVTLENIHKVTATDAALNRIIDKMTPGTCVKLIKDGINPLEISLEELEKKIDSYDRTPEKEADNYARFLQRIESRNEITAEEKESFIGIYRMLHFLDKSDGAALGSLVNSGAEITFKNLISSLRTGKTLKSGIDIQITEDMGELATAAGYEGDISLQIMTAFAGNGTGEGDRENLQRDLEQLRRDLAAGEGSIEKLTKMGEKITPEVLNAMEELLSENTESTAWKALKDRKWEDTKNRINKYKESFTDKESAENAFLDIVHDVADKLADACELEDVKALDLQQLKSTYKQLCLAGNLIKEETYSVPVEIDGKTADLRIKIIHDPDSEGNMTATLCSGMFGRITAQFTIKDGNVEGLIAGDDKEGLERLKNSENLVNSFKEGGFKDGIVRYIHSENLNYTSLYLRNNAGDDKSDTSDFYRIAKIFMDEIERAGMSR